MDQVKHLQCLICQSVILKPIYRSTAHHLVKCEGCGFVFAENIPTNSELVQTYERYERNSHLSPVTVRRYNELLDLFEKYRSTNRLLDVGCGSGYFLEVALQRGWKVYGTEFTSEAIRICKEKGIDMQEGKLDPENYEAHSFDVITSFEVLEHINNPVEEAIGLQLLIRPGGLLYITTPNFNSLSRRFLGGKWNVLAYPEHLCYYTPATISNLFINQEFHVLKLETTGISITRAKTSLKLSNESNSSELSADEMLRRKLESNNFLALMKRLANQLLTWINSGDTIKVFLIRM